MYVFFRKSIKFISLRNKTFLFLLAGAVLLVLYYFSLPSPLFDEPYATTIESREGELLGAKIASDGQWRFPQSGDVPGKFATCIVQYEDAYFYKHPGFNPVSLYKSLVRNLKARRVVSGGSTLTMQVIRMSRQKSRTVWEKCIEILLATRLELSRSKKEILALYASHAPFGGNVVGLESASWRYFGRDPEKLSWAEAATLAVLPNSPSLVYPGKNQERLKQKRDFLLHKLLDKAIIDTLTYTLSLTEPLPGAPHRLPQAAPHLLQRTISDGNEGSLVKTTIDRELQGRAYTVINRHFKENKYNQVNNASALIIKVETGEVLAYIGNTSASGDDHHRFVDMNQARRSTGSILKPFLFAGMLDEGIITPSQLYPDIPTFFDGFSPKNYLETFDGAVPANEALARSLNIPAVYMLKDYGYEKFHFLLNRLGLSTVNKSPGHYGLSLVLGGAEGTLWELTSLYAGMARTLSYFNRFTAPHRYDVGDFHSNKYLMEEYRENAGRKGRNQNGLLSAPSIWFTFDAMLDVHRPAAEASWRLFDSSRKVAWKTGTSYGFRDAWAIGVTPEYVVGVWVGNADGEGRPGLTGLQEAAPVMFDLFNLLPATGWFGKPVQGIAKAPLCKFSGYLAGMNCPETVERDVPESSLLSRSCPYCTVIHLDGEKKHRVNDGCSATADMVHSKWFVLPPVMEWYYQKKNPFYIKTPAFKDGCAGNFETARMEMVYPKNKSTLYIPRRLDGSLSEAVFSIAHSDKEAAVHWHLDHQYLATTRSFHQLPLSTSPGEHVLTLVDENGAMLECRFTVIGK